MDVTLSGRPSPLRSNKPSSTQESVWSRSPLSLVRSPNSGTVALTAFGPMDVPKQKVPLAAARTLETPCVTTLAALTKDA